MPKTKEHKTQDADSHQEGQASLPAPRPSGQDPQRLRGLALRYGTAVLSVVVATLVRQAFNPILKDKAPFMFHFLAVLFMAWYGGLGPALLTILLGTLAGAYYFVSPHSSFAITNLADQLTVASYLVVSVGIAVISDAQRKARSHLEQGALEAQSQRDVVQESQELLATTLRSIGDAVIATNNEGRVTFMNRVAEHLTGWSEAEAKGKPIARVFAITNQETGQAVESPVERVLREGVVVGLANHTVLTARDGTKRPIDDSGAPIRDRQGRIFGVVLVFRDVTEQRRAQEAQERLAALVDSSEDAIIGKDLNGIITSWNSAAERLYGYSPEEAIGRSKAIIIPPDQPEELPGILRSIKSGERVEHYDTRRVRKDGTLVDVSISVSPLKDAHGQIVGASTIARDITQSKRAQDALARHQAEIEALNVRLQRAMSETHHRVKNNLQIITALLNLQTLNYEESVPVSELERLMQHIRSLAAIHDLLTHQAKVDPEVSDVSVKEAMEKLMPTVQGMVAGRPIAFDVEDARMPVRHSTALAVLVNELVSNAIKHGGGKIEVRFAVTGDTARLEVTDEGRGFSKEFNATHAANTGLELIESLSRWDLQGQITYTNREEGGARIVVEFPVPSLSKTSDEE